MDIFYALRSSWLVWALDRWLLSSSFSSAVEPACDLFDGFAGSARPPAFDFHKKAFLYAVCQLNPLTKVCTDLLVLVGNKKLLLKLAAIRIAYLY